MVGVGRVCVSVWTRGEHYGGSTIRAVLSKRYRNSVMSNLIKAMVFS